ncbi:hypothetical protein DFH94DRAFT_848875 [Russula ochroleuca]|uniref:Fungal STAND N-terminal Goodbye domain-containing protein n=1 Tax=Russula ochroleuca TaxID=152965 RepID=A0A9P5MML3_9AGAM|nr:hypothetical protein DFH94DRAFT_848875 [Russula ochroleuca]
MSTGPSTSTSTSQSDFVSIFNAALETYKRKTKKDLVSHPLLPNLQSCDSPEAILTVLRERIPAFSQSQTGDDGLTKWVTPTVNVLYSFSATLGQGVGLAFPSANAIFAGIGVLLLAAKDTSSSNDKLIDVFNRIERFFGRLEIYTSIAPTIAMKNIIVEIMVEVLTILAIATKEVKRGGLKKYLKKVMGNTDIEDSLARLDKLTQEEARMASAELLKITQGVDDRVKNVQGKIQDVRSDVHDVGNQVQGIEGKVEDVRGDVQDARGDVQDVGNKVQDVDHKVQSIGGNINHISSGVQGVNDKLDQVNRSLSL